MNYNSVGEVNNAELVIYPVPAKQDVHIVFPETDSRLWQLTVFNVSGNAIYTKEIHNSGKTLLTVDVSSYIQGLYEFVLSNPGGVYRKKVMVSR